MEKIKAFQLTGIRMSGFKSYSAPAEFTFGNPTAITGGNARGKSSIADAIAFAITGLPFFGERRIDRLHSDDNPELYVGITFVDGEGTTHRLDRSRKGNRMTVTYDGYDIRQSDLNDMFGERDIFLSVFNPLYFIEELGESGKDLLQRHLPLISKEDVLAQLSETTQKALAGTSLTAPEGEIKKLRESVRDLESTLVYLQGQQDMADSQRKAEADTRADLVKSLEALRAEESTLTAKQYDGMDVEVLQEELAAASAQYSDLTAARQTGNVEQAVHDLVEKLAQRRAEVYQPKYAEPIAEASAKIKAMAAQYRAETNRYSAIEPGYRCPTCHREVTEEEVPVVKKSLEGSINELLQQGKDQRAQLNELQELEKKSRAVFRLYQAEDVSKLEQQLQEAQDQLGAGQSEKCDQLLARMQSLTSTLELGRLTREEHDRLDACRRDIRDVEAALAALDKNPSPSPKELQEKARQVQERINADKSRIQHLTFFLGKRAEMTFSQLRMNRVEISLFDVVKSTGEIKDTFRFTYDGRRYDRLSLSEKIRAGMEVSELIKRLTGRNYPVFIDNMESVDELNNVRPTGQVIMAKCISGQPLSVRAVKPISIPSAEADNMKAAA